MDNIYPAGPAHCPKKLTNASRAYRRHAWFAMIGLTVFVLLYLALTAWFCWTTYRLIAVAVSIHKGALMYWIAGLSSGFLAIFMLKSLFLIRRGGKIDDIEITKKDEPLLFKFLYRLADEAKAPRPHRVFLSAEVNAAVFYDLSLLNLIFPSRKNLLIGLPLVNVLTLSELKAVLAHEFGHFGQRSMAVGRWVYVAQQIAAHIVAQRGALDNFLVKLSHFDIRVAWIGWVLRIVVWSLRAVMETVFNWVVLAQRALSRDMEFQADLVSVSLTGSDALIHALHKLQSADGAWDRALSFVDSEFRAGIRTKDAFVIQLQVLENLRAVYADPEYGLVPPMPEKPETHRVFKEDIAYPPRMWATHPLNNEREENAKRTYISAPLDDRSAWVVFADANALKEKMTLHLFAGVEPRENPLVEKPVEDSLQALNSQYVHEFLKQEYCGVYMGRSVVRHAPTLTDLYHTRGDMAIADLNRLYPQSLVNDLEQLRTSERERDLLVAVRDGYYQAAGKSIRYKGTEITRRDIPKAVRELNDQAEVLLNKIVVHDRRCRTTHREIAKTLQQGWDDYLFGLVKVLHFADHTEADLLDAYGKLNNVVEVITADRNVSSSELKRLVVVAGELYSVLEQIYAQSDEIQLDTSVISRLEIESWEAAVGEWELSPPTDDNINDWMNIIAGWVRHTDGCLSGLRYNAQEQLLVSEAKLKQHFVDKTPIEAAPTPSVVPESYPILVPGKERELQTKLGLWDRFQTADGFFPGLMRFLVSFVIIGSTLGYGFIMIYSRM